MTTTTNAEPQVTAESQSAAPLAGAGWVVWSLAHRELVRFFRQRNRVFGAIGQPLVFWILFGAGLGPSFRLPDQGGESTLSYREYFFPGTIVLILLFTAIFSTISIIEDRREGFLQSVLVAPISRWAMVLGKLLGGSLIALLQGLLFLLLGFTLGISVSPGGLVAIVALLFIVSFALCGLGFVLAWRMDSTQGFHAVMSLLLMPMWLLSGAFFPDSGGWLGWIIRVNPLTYGVAALRRLLYSGVPDAVPASIPSLTISWSVTIVFALVMFAASIAVARKRTTGDLL